MARRQRFYVCIGTEPTQNCIGRSPRLIIWHGIVKRLRHGDAPKEPTVQWPRVIMRPCHDIRYGAQKEPAYRVRVRLVRVIKVADHGRKKNAKSELKIPFTGQAHDYEVRPELSISSGKRMPP